MRTALWIGLLFFLVISPWIDLSFARLLFREGGFASSPLLDALFHYGPWPAFALVGGAALCAGLSIFSPRFLPLLRPALYAISLACLGPGLLVHGVLKECWGRPRPRMVKEFGGIHSFQPVYRPRLFSSVPMKSFPSGHSSMGFYFFGLAYLGKHLYGRRIALLGWCLAFFLGSIIGLTRMAQGGHFFTDIFFSGLLMWFLAHRLAQWILLDERSDQKTAAGF